jgi:hypothetical protein
MGLALEHPVALLDHREADRLRKMALPGAGPAKEQSVGMLGNPARGGELEDEGAVHLLVELEVEAVQALADVAEAGLLEATIEQAILAADEFVLDEAGEETDGGQLLGLSFEEAASRLTAMPEQRSWRRACCSSITFMD